MSAAVQEAGEEREQRLARARAVLGEAERSAARWGGRADRAALRSLSRRDAAPSAPEASADDGLGTRLPVPGPLAALFPQGSLRAGSTVAVEGGASTSLLLALAASAAGEESWCAIAGMPDLGLRSALDAGLDPDRLTIAPAPGEQTPQILSALVDGVGVLVLGADLDVGPALWRSLAGRARSTGALVLTAAPRGRADLLLRVLPGGWSGLGDGSGRLRRRRTEVVCEGRGIAGQHRASVLLPQVGGVIAEAPQRAPRVRALGRPERRLQPVRRAG